MDSEISLHLATDLIYIAISDFSFLTKWKWCSTKANSHSSSQEFFYILWIPKFLYIWPLILFISSYQISLF